MFLSHTFSDPTREPQGAVRDEGFAVYVKRPMYEGQCCELLSTELGLNEELHHIRRPDKILPVLVVVN